MVLFQKIFNAICEKEKMKGDGRSSIITKSTSVRDRI